ncbi:MAG TPA: matrixin family metalloprotease [Polyangiales bacterium]|nr:matrixin family metalloprotease [Polyangiales bacterium]
MTRWKTLTLALGTSLLLAAPEAHAFRVIGAQSGGGTTCAGTPLPCSTTSLVARWFNNPVPFWVNSSAAADASDAALTQVDVVAAARDAYQAWEDAPGAIIKFAYVSQTAARLGADGINTTLFFNPALDSGSCLGNLGAPSGGLAVTVLTEVAGTGEIIDADVVFDSADPWAYSTDCLDFDLRSTMAHEYGHSIGIHHTELVGLPEATRPTMEGFYFCDTGIASERSLEPDDVAAAACLYPENPTVVLMDQTGSMSAGSRMADAQESANAFISDLADATMAVSAFAAADCGRDGYDQLQDWTTDMANLQMAVVSTSPCGNTPLWESTCCALGKAVEMAPSSVLVITDTEENSSDSTCSADCPAGFCGCTSEQQAFDMFNGEEVTLYVIDVTDYHGTGSLTQTTPGAAGDGRKLPVPGRADFCSQVTPNEDGKQLKVLAERTGGIYCSAADNPQLSAARIAIERHMTRTARNRQGEAGKQ